MSRSFELLRWLWYFDRVKSWRARYWSCFYLGKNGLARFTNRCDSSCSLFEFKYTLTGFYLSDRFDLSSLFEMSNAKNWSFTLNNYVDADIAAIELLAVECSYLIYGKEIGESGTPHLQGCFTLHKRKRFLSVKSLFGPSSSVHLSATRNLFAAQEYCKKDGDFQEFGTAAPGSGCRSDLDAFKDDVKQGNHDLASLREIHTEVCAKYYRFVIDYVNDNAPKKFLDARPFYHWQGRLNDTLCLPPDEGNTPYQLFFPAK